VPSTSKKQHNLMAMVANDPKAAKRLGVPQSVGAEFVKADKGRKFGSGTRSDLAEVNKPKTDHGKMNLFKGGGMAHDDIKQDLPMMKKVAKQEVASHEKKMHKMAKGGVTRADGCVTKGHTKGKMITMCGGGYMKKGK
jgi:hypothetical protein